MDNAFLLFLNHITERGEMQCGSALFPKISFKYILFKQGFDLELFRAQEKMFTFYDSETTFASKSVTMEAYAGNDADGTVM
jgi:hypothetical protein